MVLRTTAKLVLAGLLAGSVLACVGSRLIASRLYGVAPQDPLNLMLATGVLLLVAFIASYVPARRASRTDPMAALHQGCTVTLVDEVIRHNRPALTCTPFEKPAGCGTWFREGA
jgi:hypothetical protein